MEVEDNKKGGEIILSNFIYFAIFGLIAGGIANYIDPRPSSGGLLGYLALGVVGATVGGYLGGMFFGVGVTGFNLSSFIVAVLGSLLMLWVGRMLTGRK